MRFAIPFLLAVQLAAAVPPPAAEKTVRARAGSFYTLLVARKFRESEPFVFPGDRDDYYAMQKPLIYDFTIKKVTLDAAHKTAILEIESTTKVQRAMVGQMTIPISYESYWKQVNGTWFWYIPNQEIRDTPFGKMVFSKKDAALENADELKKRMAEAPSAAALLAGVKADKNALTVGPNAGNSAAVTLTNTLPGRVHLVAPNTSDPLLTVELTPVDLGQGERASLVVKRVGPGVSKPAQIVVKVEPTQQQIAIQVQ